METSEESPAAGIPKVTARCGIFRVQGPRPAIPATQEV